MAPYLVKVCLSDVMKVWLGKEVEKNRVEVEKVKSDLVGQKRENC